MRPEDNVDVSREDVVIPEHAGYTFLLHHVHHDLYNLFEGQRAGVSVGDNDRETDGFQF